MYRSFLETVVRGEGQIVIVLELTEEGVVVFSKKEVAARFEFPMVGKCIGGGRANVAVLIVGRPKGEESERPENHALWSRR